MTKPIKLGPFLGVNNRLQDFALQTKAGSYLHSAINVDITNTGDIVRRRGEVLLQAMSNAHSIEMVTDTTGFMVRGSVLYRVTLPAYTETLVAILSSDANMSYSNLGDDWYYSNGADIGRVNAGVNYPIAMAPVAAPVLTTIGGSLLSGQYQVGITYVNATTGEEGAISDLAYKELTTTGGIRVALPGVLTGATHVNVYLSESNGTVQMLHSSVTTATASIDLTTLPTGRPASARSEDVLPAGTLFYSNGRLCSFKGKMVYVGLPFRPGYYLPLSGFILFTETVTMAIANESGTYIAADKTYFIPGDLHDTTEKVHDVIPCGAVPGTTFTVPHKKTVGWFSKRGFVLADTDGSIDTSMSENVDVVVPVLGVANVTEVGGFRKVSGCGYSMNLENKAVTTYEGWDFTSVSRRFGTKTDGIYQIDTADAVTATVNFGKHDFGSDLRKGMPSVYLGMKSSAVLNLRIQAPGPTGGDYTYATRSCSTDLQLQRIDPGKGLISNWFDLELTNTAGADFTLATITAAPVGTTRRI